MPHNIQDTITLGPTRHEEMNDFIGRAPGWLLKSGITMIAIVTLTIVGMSYFIQYPDKLSGTGILTADNPPIKIVTNVSGYIDTLIVKGGQCVEEGDAIGYIHNTTNPDEVNVLVNWITRYEKGKKDELPNDLQLGRLQGEYASLQLQLKEQSVLLRDNMVQKQVENIRREISKSKELIESSKKEIQIYADEMKLVQKDHHRNLTLFNDGVISELEYEKAKTSKLQKERALESMHNGIIQLEIRIEGLKMQSLQVQNERTKSLQSSQNRIDETIARIKTGVKDWDQTYTLLASRSGILSYVPQLTQYSSLRQGQVIGYILPKQKGSLYVTAQYPMERMGKVEIGQEVLLRFDAYPYKEYGVVRSKVSSISAIPEVSQEGQRYYEVRVDLQYPIETDYKKQIEYKPDMTVMMDVITEERSVFDRIFDQFLRLVIDIN